MAGHGGYMTAAIFAGTGTTVEVVRVKGSDAQEPFCLLIDNYPAAMTVHATRAVLEQIAHVIGVYLQDQDLVARGIDPVTKEDLACVPDAT